MADRNRDNEPTNDAAGRSTVGSDSLMFTVGIGASAGGLEALQEFFSNMPADSGMAFVVVTHQHPGHTSLLPELLSKTTEMPVAQANDGQRLQPNHVYIGPAAGYLSLINSRIIRTDSESTQSPKLPIDHFFRALAEDQRERAICIILSGTGSDGTLGLKAVKGESGMAMVERPNSAKYAGMPSSAIATGIADYVLTPAEMPEQLIAYTHGPYAGDATSEEPSVPAEPMQKIFLLLRNHTGHDFSNYKTNTLCRRIQRRMNVHQIQGPHQYVRYLQENPHEIDILFKELLISVTNFFRDPDAWQALTEPLEQLLQSRSEGETVRAWVPGCASGEEVYSLAILLRESMQKLDRHLDVQVFGTDLDIKAIEIARYGKYPSGIAVDVDAERLERFFVHEVDHYRIRKEVREMSIFAPQNVIRDPPFTKLNLISCRNLLIYLNPDLQKKVLPVFHYALKPDGLLFLGPSETIGTFTELFEVIDKRAKIFRRREVPAATATLPEIPAQAVYGVRGGGSMMPQDEPTKQAPRLATQIERLLLHRFVPTSVIVNGRGEIVYIHGRTGTYLEPTEGQPRANILEMAREGLKIALTSAIRQCLGDEADVVCENVRVKTNGDFTRVQLAVSKLVKPESLRGLLLVTLRPAGLSDSAKAELVSDKQQPPDEDQRTTQLERELQFLKESNQSTLEELETSNEELKSTNEELQSTNEEMQSTNEELETSKEEMQSLNEELSTVNSELQSKVDALSQANDDMQNLLNSTDIATVFLDNDLNVKRFTDSARDLIMLRQSDIGRPVSELASKLDRDDLIECCRGVLRTLTRYEDEICTRDGIWYLMRIVPYRTTENVIDGLVVTFVNIQQLKEAQHLGTLRDFFESIVETVRQPLVVLDDELRVVSANQSFFDSFELVPDQIVGKLLPEIGEGEWRIPELQHRLESILPRSRAVQEFELQWNFSTVGPRRLRISARRLKREKGLPAMLLIAMEVLTATTQDKE